MDSITSKEDCGRTIRKHRNRSRSEMVESSNYLRWSNLHSWKDCSKEAMEKFLSNSNDKTLWKNPGTMKSSFKRSGDRNEYDKIVAAKEILISIDKARQLLQLAMDVSVPGDIQNCYEAAKGLLSTLGPVHLVLLSDKTLKDLYVKVQYRVQSSVETLSNNQIASQQYQLMGKLFTSPDAAAHRDMLRFSSDMKYLSTINLIESFITKSGASPGDAQKFADTLMSPSKANNINNRTRPPPPTSTGPLPGSRKPSQHKFRPPPPPLHPTESSNPPRTPAKKRPRSPSPVSQTQTHQLSPVRRSNKRPKVQTQAQEKTKKVLLDVPSDSKVRRAGIVPYHTSGYNTVEQHRTIVRLNKEIDGLKNVIDCLCQEKRFRDKNSEYYKRDIKYQELQKRHDRLKVEWHKMHGGCIELKDDFENLKYKYKTLIVENKRIFKNQGFLSSQATDGYFMDYDLQCLRRENSRLGMEMGRLQKAIVRFGRR